MDNYFQSVVFFALFVCFILQAVNMASAGESLKIKGDAIIGGLVAVHEKGRGDACVSPNLRGILTVEAILFALKEINSKKHFKLNSTLGCDIWDTCPRPEIAAMDLVVNTKRPEDQLLVAAVGDLPQQRPEYHRALLLLFSSLTPHMSCISSTFQAENKLDLMTETKFIFHPTTRDKTNLQAIVDLAAHYNWTYVGIVYDDSAEGKYRADILQQEANKKMVCTAWKYSLAANSSAAQIQQFITSLKAEKNFSVIVMLTSKSIFKDIIDEAFMQKVSDLTWVVSDASWDNEAAFVNGNTAARGMLKVGTSASIVGFKAFLQDLLTTPERNKWIMQIVATPSPLSASPGDTSTVMTTSTPTQAQAPSSVQSNASSNTNATTNVPNTTLSSSTAPPSTPNAPTTSQCSNPPCNVNKTKLEEIVNKLKSMADSATCTIDSIFAVAHALAAREKCKSNCPERHDFYKYIQHVNFESLSGHQISFNSQRNLNQTKCKISILQKTSNSSAVTDAEKSKLQPFDVGTWEKSGTDSPKLNPQRPSKNIKWNTNGNEAPTSVCHEPCKPGSYKAFKETRGERECCWHCLNCEENSVSRTEDSTTCTACPTGYTANNAKDDCVKQFEDYAYWSDAGSLVMLFLMVACICFSIYVAVVLFKNRETPVMRRAKNALLILLPLVILLFLIPIPLLSKPTETSCEGYRGFFILALGIPLAALISKCVYVDNKFYDSDGQVKESWGNCICTPRIAVAIGTVILHVAVIIVLAVLLPNEIVRFPTDDPFTVYIECSLHSGWGFLFVIFYIMVMATLYSVLSLSEEISPENDMEVRWTSLCIFNWYAICFVYIVVGHGVVGKGKIWGLAFVDLLFAVNILVCIYLPKWYVIVFQPEKNQSDVSPWTMYVKTQEKAAVRLSEEESPVIPKRGNLASTAKETDGKVKDSGDPNENELQELISDTDV